MHGNEVLGPQIREIREAKLMTLVELARRSGVSYAYLKDIESNGRQPSGVIAHKIAAGLGVPIGKFTRRTRAIAS